MKKVNKCLHILLLYFALVFILSVSGLAANDGADKVGGDGVFLSADVVSGVWSDSVFVSADAVSRVGSDSEKTSVDVAKGEVEDVLSDFSLILPDGMEHLSDGAGEAIGFEAIFGDIFSAVRGEMPAFVGFALLLIGAAVLLSLVGQLGETVGAVARSALGITVGCIVFFRVFPLFSEVDAAFSAVGEFFTALTPVMVSGAALAGGTVAATSGTGMTVTLTLIGAACRAALPICCAATVLGVISPLAPEVLSLPLDAVRRNLTRAFAVLTAVVGGLFALQTAVAAAQDGATMRALKYAVGNSLPVVGGTVSGTLSTLVGGLGYAMGVVGGGGVAVILSLVLLPLVRLLLYRLAFFVAGLFLDCFSVGDGARVIRAMSAGLDSLTAIFSLAVTVYLFEIVVVMRSVISVG